MVEKHNSEEQDISVKVLKTCPKDPMLRQVTEAILIHAEKPTLNAKEEWGNSNIPRNRFERRTNESNSVNNRRDSDSIN